MPKLAEPITDKLMRTLPAPARGNVLYRDPSREGFSARVTAAGVRSFVEAYYFGGVERRDTIGQFPTWSTRAAWEVGKAWRKQADVGIDPRGALVPEPPAKALFKPLAEQFLAHGRAKRGRPLGASSKRSYRRALLTYAKPFHERDVTEIRRSEVQALIDAVAGRHGVPTARVFRGTLARFFGFLMPRIDDFANPVIGTDSFLPNKRNRVLDDREIALIWTATRRPGQFNLIIRMLFWTGCRRGEMGGLRESELTAQGTWTLPAERSKNYRALQLRLPRQAVAALAAYPRPKGREVLFGRRSQRGFSNWDESKAALDLRIARLNAEQRLGRPLRDGEQPAESDFLAHWGLHDCRRTTETGLAGLGISKDITGRILNHGVSAISEVYDHYDYAKEKAAALQLWADELDRITGETRGQVIELAKHAS